MALSDPNPKVPLDLTVKRGDKIVPLTIQRDAAGHCQVRSSANRVQPGGFARPVPDGNAAAGLNPGETVVGPRRRGTAFTPVTKFLDLELAFARNAGRPLTLRVQAPAEGEKPGGIPGGRRHTKVLTPDLVGQRRHLPARQSVAAPEDRRIQARIPCRSRRTEGRRHHPQGGHHGIPDAGGRCGGAGQGGRNRRAGEIHGDPGRRGPDVRGQAADRELGPAQQRRDDVPQLGLRQLRHR